MAPPETPSPQPPGARPRRHALVTTLVVIASILSLLSILTGWANRQVLNTLLTDPTPSLRRLIGLRVRRAANELAPA
jgi:hypothetical protein